MIESIFIEKYNKNRKNICLKLYNKYVPRPDTAVLHMAFSLDVI